MQLDQRLHMLRQEVRMMSQDKEREECVWKEKLQRCQRQLKAKDEETSRQSQYFENFKAQLQKKLSLARDREHSLQNRIYSLEKQLLDVTVSSATGMATITAFRITAGTVAHMNELDKLPRMRGEGEGEEENKEDKKKHVQANVATVEKERVKVDDIDGGRENETKQTSNEARLQGFIISLQEDLKVLLEREEDGLTERRKLLEELQEAQENGYFLDCKVEEMKAELRQLRQSESTLMEEVDDLRKENQSLQQLLTDASPLSPAKPEATSSAESRGKADMSAIQMFDHQGAAEYAQNNTDNHFTSAKSKTPKRSPLDTGSKPNLGFQSVSFSAEFVAEPKLGNVEELPSEESDALRAAFHSLGFGNNFKALKEQNDHLEVQLEHTKAELQAVAQESAELKLQLRRETEQSAKVQCVSKKKIITPSTCKRDHLTNSAEDDTIPDWGDLIHALNRENRALADRIQKLMAHIKLGEEEIKKEQTYLKERIYRLEEDGVRLEKENQEQVSLISELNRKTEDDLNTIMELQQKLDESKDHCRSLCQSQNKVGTSGCFQQENMDSLVEGLLKGDEEPQLIFSQETDSLTAASSSGCKQNLQRDSSQNHSQNGLYVSSLTDTEAPLNNSIQSLKTEEKELTAIISALREEQKQVVLSLQKQTEEKQLLTRSVWAFKEQKDNVCQSLNGLKQEKEQLSRVICSLKDVRDQHTRSIRCLKEEKEELTLALSALQRDKETIKETISSSKEENDQIMKSLQSLHTESEHLSQAVLRLNKQRDELTDSLKGLKEERDQEEQTNSLKAQHDQLIMSLGRLKEEKEKIEGSIGCLKQEQINIKQVILRLKEERHNLQTRAEESNYDLNLKIDDRTKKIPDDNPSSETNKDREMFLQKETDLTKEIESLRNESKKSIEELEKSHKKIRKLHTELSESEARRQMVEKKAAEQMMRLTESTGQKENIMKENETFSMQVTELQSKLMVVLREKSDALYLKARTEEQYNILSAHFKAKTVALEELNSEYISLKRGRDSRDDQIAVLVSLRARYNDIRAKYDTLLKRKSQTDLHNAPLKAKLSCLVVKCQERNSLLAEMMTSMHRQGCVEPRLTQQAEHLLRDAALQDYAAAFSPESKIQRRDHCGDFTQDFFSAFQGCNKGFIPNPTCTDTPSCLIKQQIEVSTQSGVQCGQSGKPSLIFASETSTNPQNCWKVSPAAAEATLKENARQPTFPLPNTVSPIVPLKESVFTNSLQLSSASTSPEEAGRLEKTDCLHLEVKDGYSWNTTEEGIRLLSPSTASSSARVSPNRRLSSPEKILNLQEELQKTLIESFQVPKSRGRGKQPWKNLSPSASIDLNSSKPERHFLFCTQQTNSPPVSTRLSHTEHTPDLTRSDSSNKLTTLFNAVSSRAANAKSGPNMFTPCHFKADGSKGTHILTSSQFSFNCATHRKESPISSDDTKLTAHTKQGNEVITTLDLADVSRRDTFNTSCCRFACFSPETSHEAAVCSTAALGKMSRTSPEAPAEVRSVEVIKTVGQSSLLIGWERPPLDELGCSNRTFVYGYRVFVNKEFHKSIMSSACTKCILENIDLSIPVSIGVQTLGSNGLHSDGVNIIYASSDRK